MTMLPRLRATLPLMLMLLALSTACSDRPEPPGTGTLTVPLGDRPFLLQVPDSYTQGEPMPLVIGLHGYTSESSELSGYFGLAARAQSRGFLLALPEGTTNRAGDQFWNATDACCDFYGSGVDDSAYLSQLIDTLKSSYAVSDVFVIGHSNGGYMAHRVACEHADQITAIASLAGVLTAEPSLCNPSRPVSVVQIHGTADETVSYSGGQFPGGSYPGAEETAARWASMDGCTDVRTAGTTRDLDSVAPAAETSVTVWAEGCRDGTRVELWRMEGSRHVPSPTDDFTDAVLDFFASVATS